MRVVRPSPEENESAVSRLAAEMLCMEAGRRAFGADLSGLPEPHEPWPTVTIPPTTKQGRPITLHYTPSVAIVYYTLGGIVRDQEDVDQLLRRLQRKLEPRSEHLRGHRVVAASPCSVLRRCTARASFSTACGPRACYKKALGLEDVLPARLLQFTPITGCNEPPAHFSVRAVFTWVFMPAADGVDIFSRGFSDMSAVNATVAAIFFDAGGLSTRPDGADIPALTPGDFPFVPVPASLAAAQIPRLGTFDLVMDRANRASLRLRYTGIRETLHPTSRFAPGTLYHRSEDWCPEKIALRGGAPLCTVCDTPISGRAIVLRRILRQNVPRHDLIRVGPVAETDAEMGFLICISCRELIDGDCVEKHLGAAITETIVPLTPEEAVAASPAHRHLAPLMRGTVRRMAECEGAFILTLGKDAVILAPPSLGPAPAVSNRAIAALGLAVIPGVRIKEY